jgi:hypothetical protein
LKKHLQKNFIKSSSFSYSFSILFVRKSDEELRFYVNYKKLNAITKKNRYSFSLIAEVIARLIKIKFITKINIRHVFNRIRMITQENEKLTIFITKYDNYQYRVLSFNLTDDSFIFQQFINDFFLEWLNVFIIAYLNDLIIYSDNLKEHQKHIRKVLQRLKEIELQTNIDKCEFHVLKTKFLDMIIKKDEIRMNSAKIKIIVEWINFRHLKEMQIFLEFINFYKRFIKEFFKLVKSLINLTRKEQIFD